MKKKVLIVIGLFFGGVVCTLISHHASAETLGAGSFLDSRLQTAVYSPDNVYRIQAFIGRSSLIQFPANETVNETSGLIVSGDPDAWGVGVNLAGNLISIKPTQPNDPDTNLIVNTNRHTYIFELKLVQSKADMTYALRFTYPEPVGVKKAIVERDLNPNPCNGVMNRAYQRRGDKEVSPYEAWDNGTFTCFRFPTNAPRPVVYQVLPDGTETLVNTRNVQNIVVAHGVSERFRFRLNMLVLEVRTRQQLGGFYNYNGTTTGDIRVVKNAEQ
ncbi:TrbG/VirB9 family P-type conjugative transfer protein [Serratia proteamaculans]|uniref:TrbG/VirB9 family P-type conjugative transfer protein n=1 Tax=Serratia proteamaculans TaxID=28151 RepID=UPI003D07B469